MANKKPPSLKAKALDVPHITEYMGQELAPALEELFEAASIANSLGRGTGDYSEKNKITGAIIGLHNDVELLNQDGSPLISSKVLKNTAFNAPNYKGTANYPKLPHMGNVVQITLNDSLAPPIHIPQHMLIEQPLRGASDFEGRYAPEERIEITDPVLIAEMRQQIKDIVGHNELFAAYTEQAGRVYRSPETALKSPTERAQTNLAVVANRSPGANVAANQGRST